MHFTSIMKKSKYMEFSSDLFDHLSQRIRSTLDVINKQQKLSVDHDLIDRSLVERVKRSHAINGEERSLQITNDEKHIQYLLHELQLKQNEIQNKESKHICILSLLKSVYLPISYWAIQTLEQVDYYNYSRYDVCMHQLEDENKLIKQCIERIILNQKGMDSIKARAWKLLHVLSDDLQSLHGEKNLKSLATSTNTDTCHSSLAYFIYFTFS
ncbi:hypothetical protein GJ496_000874 [Pomphorhynchus laevis]|nr:hypothetical protein GJ496_000874 [Pomphorhynchus laevis]